MLKKFLILFTSFFIFTVGVVGCNPLKNKYTAEYTDLFDTYTSIILYTSSEDEFNRYSEYFYTRMSELNKLYDIYNNYEAINNLKTINDNAGIAPVKVSDDIINLLEFSKKAFLASNKTINVSMGAVLKIWHSYRTNSLENPEKASVPPLSDLKEAYLHTDINSIIIDKKNKTVFIENPKASIDVGAVAKGYALETVKNELISQGLSSALLNTGGNIVTIGTPAEYNKESWVVGIQNPDFPETSENQVLQSVKVSNGDSVVSSGDYQRFYTVNGKRYNHIINPATLMPAENFKAVTIIHNNSQIADMLSTAVFILPYEEGKKLIEKYNAKALWVFKDSSVKTLNW